jgi:hypothetical protein
MTFRGQSIINLPGTILDPILQMMMKPGSSQYIRTGWMLQVKVPLKFEGPGSIRFFNRFRKSTSRADKQNQASVPGFSVNP